MFKPLSVYFHWPYCKSKCPYCDFFKIVKKNVDEESLAESYISELKYYQNLVPQRKVQSIFFGGGTPSLMNLKTVEKLIDAVFCLWGKTENVEITLEANPNSDRAHLFSDLKKAGVNRLSLGVQALNSDDLKFLGRTHTLKEAYKSIDEVLKVFDNHSIDLIYARPYQKLEDWEKELQQAVSFGFKHLSLYQLTIEDGTVFFKKGVKALEDEKASKMYQTTVDFLREHGYPRYEVSNFAMPVYESIHNKCYWQGDDYIGIGESAHGRLNISEQNFSYVHPHISEPLSNFERAEELLIMGLRLQKGINKTHFKEICGLDFETFINQEKLQTLVAEGFLIDEPHSLRATDQGFLVLDKLVLELLR